MLTVDQGSFLPANRLTVQRLNLLNSDTVADSQQFTLQAGPEA